MRKIYATLMALATVAAALVSCSKEVDNQKEERVSGKMKTIAVKTDIETRTTLDANHENIVWSAGDKISIFNDVNDTNLETAYVAGGDLTVEVPEETTEIYAHYPYWSGNTSGPKSVSVNILKSQTQKNPGELNGYNYPMVAKGTVSADNKALISLYPVASALALNIYHTGLEGDESVKSVTVTPATQNTSFIGSQSTDLTKDDITYTAAALSDPITVTLTNAYALGNTKPTNKQKFEGQIYVCLAKQSYANVTFEIQTTKGKYTITSSATPFDCENNDFVPVNINLAKATFEEAEELSGVYVILAEKEADGVSTLYAMANTHNDNSNRLDEVVFAEGTTTTDNRAIVWGVAKSGDGYTITDLSGKYLTASNGNDANVGATVTSCSITENADGTYYVTQVSGETTRYLSRNDSNKGFAFYGNTSQNCKLTLVKVQLQALPILTWGEESIILDATDEEEHEITLTAVDATSVTVQVFDEDETTAIDWLVADYAEGVVTYMAEANTGEIRKAVMIATATNDYGSVTAKINVTQKADNSHVTKGETWSYTFTSNPFSNKAASLENNGTVLTWNSTVDPGWTNDALSFGSNNNTVAATLSTTSYQDGVSSVAISIKGNSGKKVKAEVKVNGIALTCNSEESVTHTGNTLTSYEFKSSSLEVGEIAIIFTEPSGGYQIKSITINPAPATVTGISVEDYTETFTASETGTYAFDGKVYAIYSDETKTELDAANYNVTGSVNLTTAGTYTLTFSATIDGTDYSKDITITVNPEGTELVVYTLTPASGTNNGYATNCDITIDGITWNLTGNSQQQPWRIGGKSLSGVDRALYSKTALNYNISKIEITHGAASDITVNSMTVIVASDAEFNNVVSTLTPTFAASSTVTVERPEGKDWSDCYYKIVYNVTVSGSSNKFLEFTKAEFTGK